MRVLVTGANGFIGQACVRELNFNGAEVFAIGRHRPEGILDFFSSDLLSTQDFYAVMLKAKPSHLLHLAWYAEHGKYWSSPLNQDWVRATQDLTKAFCASGGKHAVFAGTCAEYDWTAGECNEDLTSLKPSSLYGAAKVEASRIAEAVCNEHGTRFSWGRIFQPFGPDENSERLVPALIDVFTGRRKPFGVSANSVRDFIYSKDVARAFFALLTSDATGYFNIASGTPLRIEDVTIEIAKACGADPRIVLNLPPSAASDPLAIIGATDKLSDLGWAPKFSFHQAITEMLKA